MATALTPEELDSFNKDLAELCLKHNVTLSIGQQIVVNKKEDSKEAKTESK